VTACTICDGDCAEANLTPLLTANLTWLWQRLAETADRRGDPALTAGFVTVTAPASPEQRAAVLGLLPGRPLVAGQSRRVELAALATSLRRHGTSLTPGAIAAHAVGRRLAARARRRDDRDAFELSLASIGAGWARSSASPLAARWDQTWSRLRRAGWVARLHTTQNAEALLRQALTAVDKLPEPGDRLDRRVLASLVAHDPHALDDGEPLTAVTMALLTGSGVAPSGHSRDMWAAVGVNCDDLTGGLIAVGIYPLGWHLPPGTVVTLPPRELSRCTWTPPAQPGSWVFVTENPSVASAAADVAAAGTPVHLLCTSGTPSAVEVAAVVRLLDTGWQLAVRADFDAAGIAHVRAVLDVAPAAHAWRMTTADYKAACGGETTVSLADVPDTPWDPTLAEEMRATGAAAFEEASLPELLDDLRAGEPP
jgi:uncharacterized protein (TIGR02679 family)